MFNISGVGPSALPQVTALQQATGTASAQQRGSAAEKEGSEAFAQLPIADDGEEKGTVSVEA